MYTHICIRLQLYCISTYCIHIRVGLQVYNKYIFYYNIVEFRQTCRGFAISYCVKPDDISNMYEPIDGSITRQNYLERCKQAYNVDPVPGYIKNNYGEKILASSSNIILR